jgi:hypothetical protein
MALVDAARARGKKLRRAASTATFSGWTTGLFASTALAGGLLGIVFGGIDWPALFLGIPMTVVTINEFRGAAKLRRAERTGPRLLGLNQLFLLLAIGCYCVWNMFFVPSSLAATKSGDPHVDELLAGFSGLEATARIGLYGAVFVGSLLAQGLTALYYFSRSRYVSMYLEQTPAWLVDLNRRAASA